LKSLDPTTFCGKTKIIKNSMTGQAITRITLTKIKSFRLPLPPLPEQKKIASILSTADDKLETLQTKKTSYEALQKGLMEQLLTGVRRVKL
jgi:type I restriction enzyme S subunit